MFLVLTFEDKLIKTINKLFDKSISFYIPNNLRVLIFGGDLKSNCFRNKLIEYLKQQQNYLTIIPDKINYFDISSEQYNLVEKETRLFENSDILIVIPESPGSFAEIGMIASMISNPLGGKHKKKHAEKVYVILDEKYKHDESFLKLGPIKSIKYFGGSTINVNFNTTNFSRIENQFKQITKPKRIYLNSIKDEDLFFMNSIKILIYIYYHKNLEFYESDYKNTFIETLKEIHKSIHIDNIEYLESTELINKHSSDGKIIININHKHMFMKKLIELNFSYFKRNQIINSFLTKCGY